MSLPFSVPCASSSRALPVTVASTTRRAFQRLADDLAEPLERRVSTWSVRLVRPGLVQRDRPLAVTLTSAPVIASCVSFPSRFA